MHDWFNQCSEQFEVKSVIPCAENMDGIVQMYSPAHDTEGIYKIDGAIGKEIANSFL